VNNQDQIKTVYNLELYINNFEDTKVKINNVCGCVNKKKRGGLNAVGLDSLYTVSSQQQQQQQKTTVKIKLPLPLIN
jgi:hypothetical protein